MNKRGIIFFLITITVVLSACQYSLESITGRVVDVDSCGVVTEDIRLISDINVNGTCFTIGADNIVIDGNGYTMTGGELITMPRAIYNPDGYDHITIKNFAGINEFPFGAIGMKQSESLIITNNILRTSGRQGSGISIVDCPNAIITDNTIDFDSHGIGGIAVLSTIPGGSDSATITGNNIVTAGSSPTSGAIELRGSKNSLVKDNIIWTSGSHTSGVFADSQKDTTISNNQITTTGYRSYGIYVISGSSGITVSSNSIETSSSNSPAVYIYRSDGQTITSNTIKAHKADTLFIVNSSGNTVEFNTLESLRDGYAAIHLRYGSSSNIFESNEIHRGPSFTYRGGIYLGDDPDNVFTGTIIDADSWDIFHYPIYPVSWPEYQDGRVYETGGIVFNNIFIGDEELTIHTLNAVYVDNASATGVLPENKLSLGYFDIMGIAEENTYIDFTFYYEEEDIVDIDESTLALYHYNSQTEEWDLVSTSTVDTNNNNVNSGLLSPPYRFSGDSGIYAILGTSLVEIEDVCQADCTKGDNTAYLECELHPDCEEVETGFLDPTGSGIEIADCDNKIIGQTYNFLLSAYGTNAYCIGDTLYETYSCEINETESGTIVSVNPIGEICEFGCEYGACLEEELECQADCTGGDNIAHLECESHPGCEDVAEDCDDKVIGDTYSFLSSYGTDSYCIGDILYETYTCQIDDGASGIIVNVSPIGFTCEEGCEEGACIGEGDTYDEEYVCSDSDSGKNYYVKGNVSYKNITYVDSCNIDESTGYLLNPEYYSITLIENYCENNQLKIEYHNCFKGCENGRCLEEVNFSSCPNGVCEDDESCSSCPSDCGECEEVEEEELPGVSPIKEDLCNPDKVLVCHITSSGKEVNVCVSKKAVNALIQQGDYKGVCVDEKRIKKKIRNVKRKELKNVEVTLEDSPIQGITVKFNKEVDEVEMIFRSREVPPQGVRKIDRPVKKYVIIDHPEVEQDKFNKTNLRFRLEKIWVETNANNLSDVVLTKYVNHQWVELPNKLLKEDNTYYYFEAESDGLSVFAVTIKEDSLKIESKEKTEETPSEEEEIKEPLKREFTEKEDRGIYWIISVISLISAVILFRAKPQRKDEKETEKDSFKEEYSALIKFVRDCRRKGKTEKQILKELEEADWKSDVIEKVMSDKYK